ncbi:hypothetical protein [Intrasporangium sp.]|uniref:hypothetical protein n=1 Tax=Intrasporangium sp. TaxID=1925024 RepID=UPI003221C3B8
MDEITTPGWAPGNLSHDDVATLAGWMARHGYTADEVAHAVLKPWHYLDEIRRAKLDLPPADEDVADTSERP